MRGLPKGGASGIGEPLRLEEGAGESVETPEEVDSESGSESEGELSEGGFQGGEPCWEYRSW